MKRTKLHLSVIVALLLAIVMSFALVACGDNSNNNNNGNNNGDNFGITDSSSDTLSLQGLKLSGNYTTSFALGTPFSSEGLVVTAVLNDYNISDAYTQDVVLQVGEYEIDSSDYNPNRVGIYTIYVIHTRTNVTRTASYTVSVESVVPEFGGIIAKLAEGKSDTFALTESEPQVTISGDILAVYEKSADGSETLLEADKYNADLYLGSQKIEGNVASENGTYSLVATLKADESKQDFIPVYVVNPVKSIELDKTAGGVFEQAPGMVDHMSETWQFTVTYESGATKTVKAGDAGLTIELDTRSAGSKTATVTFVDGGFTVTCKVAYTITGGGSTQPAADPLVINISDLVNAGTLAVQTYSEEVALGADDNTSVSVLADESNAVSVDANGKSMDGYSFTHRLKLSGKGTNEARSIKIEVSGAAIITVYMMSSSGSDSREVGVWTGSFDPNPSTGAATEPVAAIQTVGGKSLEKHEYEVSAAGTYYLAAVSGGTNVYGIIVSPVGGGSTEPVEPAGDPLVINISDLVETGALATSDLTAEVALGANDYSIVSVLANEKNKVTIDTNNKSMDGYTFTHRLKLSGKGTNEARSIKIEVSGAAVITVYMMSSSGSESREVGIWTGEFDPNPTEGTAAEPVVATQTVGGKSLEKHEYEITAAGTYYLAAVGSGTNVYGIVITPIG